MKNTLPRKIKIKDLGEYLDPSQMDFYEMFSDIPVRFKKGKLFGRFKVNENNNVLKFENIKMDKRISISHGDIEFTQTMIDAYNNQDYEKFNNEFASHFIIEVDMDSVTYYSKGYINSLSVSNIDWLHNINDRLNNQIAELKNTVKKNEEAITKWNNWLN